VTDYQNADYSERERLIGAGVTDVDTQDTSLRPVALSEFIGQQQLRDNLKVFVDAARGRQESMDHVLFHGPPGLGKRPHSRRLLQENSELILK
jgi:Holliday junction DNA helicase RuvB